MSRHRKVRNMDIDEDDYYDEMSEDEIDFDDDDIEDFESRYLKTGIDLNLKTHKGTDKALEMKNFATTPSTPKTVTEKLLESTKSLIDNLEIDDCKKMNKRNLDNINENNVGNNQSFNNDERIEGQSKEEKIISRELSTLAVKHLDKFQWQKPLLDMDINFLDKTYYKHYDDHYVLSLRSKLGQFLADERFKTKENALYDDSGINFNDDEFKQKIASNENFRQDIRKNKKMCKLNMAMLQYYQNIGTGFFNFSTPSPDELIAIGCRPASKANSKNLNVASSQQAQVPNTRFEFNGQKQKQQQMSGNKHQQNPTKKDLTVRENFRLPSNQRVDKVSQVNLNKKSSAPQNLSNQVSSSETSENKSKVQSTTSSMSSLSLSQSENQQQKQIADNISVTTKSKQLKTMQVARDEKRKEKRRKSSRQLTTKQLQQIELEQKETVELWEKKFGNENGGKKMINLIVVGHVDAGKSTLMGHLLFKLNLISKKQMHRYETDSARQGKASFKFAWILDETDEERARGVTMDVAMTKIETENRIINLLDAPGHRDFIPAVIGGAAQADCAILVVDATRGEFESGFGGNISDGSVNKQQVGQTREHTLLIRSLGVGSVIVVVNKMDNVDWDEQRFNEIVDKLSTFLRQTGFQSQDVVFVPCSGLSGINLCPDTNTSGKEQKQIQSEVPLWWQKRGGLTLLQYMDTLDPPKRLIDKPVRICIGDIYRGMSSGVFLSGKLESGHISVKQKLLLLPPNEMCEIKSLSLNSGNQSNGGGEETEAFAGDLVNLVVTGVDLNKFYRGCILCDPLQPCHVTNRFRARIVVFATAKNLLLKGSPVECFVHGITEPAIISKLVSLINRSTGEIIQKKPKCVVRNSSAIVDIQTQRVVCVETYESHRSLGRVTLRQDGQTIAAGMIVKIRSTKLEPENKNKYQTSDKILSSPTSE